MSDYMVILRAEVEKSSAAQVAREIGYSSATVSLALAGKYKGSEEKFAQAVINRYSQVLCPYLEKTIDKKECILIVNAPAPSHNPAKMSHWRACLKCELNPKEK